MNVETDLLREAFEHRLTVGSDTRDRRRREFNQALFTPADAPRFGGDAIWSEISLDMVLRAFDAAVRDITARRKG